MRNDADPSDGAEDVDIVVIGLGAGGESTTGQLAAAGLSVVAVEPELVGGECAYWACNPSKMMIRAAGTVAEARRVPQVAGAASVTPQWDPVAARIRREATTDWDDTVAVRRIEASGAGFVRGRARLTGPGLVRITPRDGSAEHDLHARRAVVLATGSAPMVPPVAGLAHTPYWTNRDAVAAATPPESLIVLGGGTVGVELAQVYARFGTTVTVLEAKDRLLATEEPEVSEVLEKALARDAITVHRSATVRSVSHDPATERFHVDCGDAYGVSGERLLVATGRRPTLAELGLDTVGIDPSASAVAVDGRMRAGQRLWAVGDVTGHAMFTHVATYQADVAVRDILAVPGPPAEYSAVPRVTVTDPEVGAVGLTAQQATAAGIRVATSTVRLPSTARGWIHDTDVDGFVKLVADVDHAVLVGATVTAPAGGEAVGALAVAVRARVPLATLRHTMYAYPTFYRGIDAALRALDA